MNKRSNNTGKIIHVMISGIIIACWISLLSSYFHPWRYEYRYVYIEEIERYIQTTLVVFGLPLASIFLYWIALALKKEKVSYACLALFFAAFLTSGFLTFSSPRMYSYTTDPDHFGKYDGSIGEYVDFPEQIPEGVEHVRYCYFCTNEPGWMKYVAVSWKFQTEEEFDKELEKYEAMALEKNQSVQITMDDVNKEVVWTQSKDGLRVFFELEKREVYYVLFTAGEYLPNHADEVFSWSPAQWP